jgi:glucose/arabinose dehydrogenase
MSGVSRQAFRWLPLAVVVAASTGAVVAQQPPNIGIAPVSLSSNQYTFDTAEQHRIRVVVVAKGLVHPFSLAFLPNGDALVTERGVRLRVIHNATGPQTGQGPVSPALDPQAVAGIPQTPAFRGGGLQEVVLHPKFSTNGFVYFTYNKAGDVISENPPQRKSAVTLARGRFDGKAIVGVEELFMGDWSAGASGSRIVFAQDGLLYMTTGAPFGDQAQKLDTVYGKVLRLRDDGRAVQDNPFAGRTGSRPEIFSFGHRDQLGIAIHPTTGAILTAEHGPNGGDEINVILPGRNYGWPTFSYGRNYDGPRISETPLGPGIEQPLVVWLPSIAPTGLTFYTGDRMPAWKGNLFVGSARRGEVPRTGGLERVVFNDKLEELRRETLLTDLHQRIRDVRQGPDGLLYLLTDEDDGALLRIEPAP